MAHAAARLEAMRLLMQRVRRVNLPLGVARRLPVGGFSSAFPWTTVSSNARDFSAAAAGIQVRYKKNQFCAQCGKRVVLGQVEDMRSACSLMWRKYMRLGDLHCPLYLAARVKAVEGHEEVEGVWEAMPRLKGRS
eukprot:TRINITY_DN54575_c0_g1_i1.p1 TRINITY_DN54575_c0_g1~~TRINITY_DN54575_c0_g1_i1.p1  ORF type:complete len:158 (+),score=17.11 TRINITY_DN54575_c0_g1_i1:71-475(+)